VRARFLKRFRNQASREARCKLASSTVQYSVYVCSSHRVIAVQLLAMVEVEGEQAGPDRLSSTEEDDADVFPAV
jgi:hypothetical protein